MDLSYLSGDQWQAVDSTAFQGQALDRTWTLTIVDEDCNGITGTLTAWSITVTPLTEGAASQGELLTAADLVFFDLGLSSPDDDGDESVLQQDAADYLRYDLLP